MVAFEDRVSTPTNGLHGENGVENNMAKKTVTGNQENGYKVLEYSDEVHAEVPEDLCIGDHGYKYRMVDGRVMPPYITPARYALSRRIQTRPTDVCFVSFPKSGSTWLSYILVLLTRSERAHSLRSSLHWVESSWTYPRSESELEAAADPRIFKSHMPYGMGLGGLSGSGTKEGPGGQKARYVYIARNPKDVCASYYKFESGKSWAGFYQGGWDHWLGMFVSGKNQRGDWFDHVLSWWEASKESDNILFVRYEDLKRDTEGTLKKLAEFLGRRGEDGITAEELAEVKKQVGFDAMRSNGFSGLKDVKEFNEFFRKGEIGSWKEYFTVAQSEAFDQLYEEKVAGSGLTFDFE